MIRYIRDKEIEQKIIEYLASKGAKKIEIFGSYARGEDYNDIDVIVEFEKVPSLFDFVGYKMDLEQTVKKEVDLLTVDSISKYIKPYIKKERKTIYEKA